MGLTVLMNAIRVGRSDLALALLEEEGASVVINLQNKVRLEPLGSVDDDEGREGMQGRM